MIKDDTKPQRLNIKRLIQLQGGSSHEVWKVSREGTLFALKILNPLMLNMLDAKARVLEGEAFAQYCQQHGIPAISLLEEQEHFAFLYPFIEGKTKYYPEFGLAEVNKIAGLLAKIHTLPPFSNEAIPLGKVYSHRDLDPKNVLWRADEPFIIDWEISGWIDPMEEVIALAFEWSGFERGEVDQLLFQAFFAAYTAAGGTLVPENLEPGLQGFIRNYEDWLEFNIHRLNANCPLAEKRLAEQEIKKTQKKLAFLKNPRLTHLARIRGY